MASNSGVQANNLPRAALVTDLIGLTGAMGDTALISLARLGVLVGEDGNGLRFDDVALVRDLGTAALAIILIEGGLTTKFSDVRKSLAPAAVMATLGVAVSTAVTAAGASRARRRGRRRWRWPRNHDQSISGTGCI